MTLINLSYPFLNGKIVDIVFYNNDMNQFMSICLVYMCVLFVNQFIVTTLNALVLSQLMTKFVFDIRKAVFSKILHGKGTRLSNMYSGDIISRINEDSTDFVNLIYWTVLWGYSNMLHITCSVLFMFYYNVFLGISTIILVPLTFFISKIFEKKLSLISQQIVKKQGKISSYLWEIVAKMGEIKRLATEKYAINKYLCGVIDINRENIESGKVVLFSERVNSLLSLFAQLCIYTICAYYIIQKDMQLGVLVSAASYFSMAENYFKSLNEKLVNLGKYKVAIQRVVDILNEEGEDYKEEIGHINVEEGNIEFKNVSFQYPNGKQILKNINICLEGKSTIGIVGKSGEGKSSFVNLICRYFDLQKGEILVDGININDYNLHDLRRQIGIVHQNTVLYENTLRYNLCFSHEKEKDQELISVLKEVGLYELYLRLPDGLDTQLGENGSCFSGGEKQRIGIARIFMKKPKIVIFDEATAALDSYNETIIKRVISRMAEDCTVLVISHRLATIENCTKILVLSEGKIVGYDSHENLLMFNDLYRELFQKQCVEGVIK